MARRRLAHHQPKAPREVALVVNLAPGTGSVAASARLEAFAIGAASIVGLVLAGRNLLNPLFTILGQARAREVLTAAAPLVVLGAAAARAGIPDARDNAILTTAIIVSTIATPFLIMLHDAFLPRVAAATRTAAAPENLAADVLLIGFERFGQIASQPMLEAGCSLTISETSTRAIFDLEPLGFKVYDGDGARLDILQAAGGSEAKLIVIAIDDRPACLNAKRLAIQVTDGLYSVPSLVRNNAAPRPLILAVSPPRHIPALDWPVPELFSISDTGFLPPLRLPL